MLNEVLKQLTYLQKQIDNLIKPEVSTALVAGGNILSDSLTYNESWIAGLTFNDLADDNYGPGLWNILNDANAPDVAGVAGGSTDPFTRYMAITLDATTRVGAVQFRTAQQTTPYRGKVVSLSADLWATGITAARMAVAVWTGSPDAVTSDLVSAWADNPTLATSWAFIGTPVDITISTTPGARKVVQNLTIPTNAVNLGIFIWTPSQEASTDVLNIARVKLEEGPVATEFIGRDPLEELLLINRFLFVQAALGDEGVAAWGWCQSTTIVRGFIPTPAPMFKAPSVNATGFLNVKSNGASVAVTSVDTIALMGNGIRIRFNVASGLTASHAAIITPSTTVAITMDGRL